MNGLRRTPRSGFTLLELLLVVVVLAILIALALPSYFRSTERARSTEALVNLAEIRKGELLHQAQYGDFTEAIDLPEINHTLELELNARYYDYQISQSNQTSFLIVATSRSRGTPLQVVMDQTGRITYTWPLTGGSAGIGGGGGGIGGSGSGGGGGGGGGGGSGGSSGGSGGGGGGAGAGASSGSGSAGSGAEGAVSDSGDSGAGGEVIDPGGSTGDGGGSGPGGGSSGGGGSEPGIPAPPTGGATAPGTFTYIPRGQSMWTDWPDVNLKNITGILGTQTLSQAFDLIAASGASAVTEDLKAKGIEIFFDPDYFSLGAPCEGAYACHFAALYPPPAEPAEKPFIVFNPILLADSPGALAAVLVHEGTHFQQFLDGSIHHEALGNLTVVDIEFRAFWNAAVYWGEIRTGQIPFNTQLKFDLEYLYNLALQGEAALRNEIAARYGA